MQSDGAGLSEKDDAAAGPPRSRVEASFEPSSPRRRRPGQRSHAGPEGEDLRTPHIQREGERVRDGESSHDEHTVGVCRVHCHSVHVLTSTFYFRVSQFSVTL